MICRPYHGCLLYGCVLSGLSLLAAVEAYGAEAKPSSPYLVNNTFEEWVWRPIAPAMGAEGRKILEAGGKLAYEYRGPLFRIPVGFALPAGRMVEGPEAYHGRSLLLDATWTGWTVGLHGPYVDLFEAGKTYHYEVALKGKGRFQFRGWVGGVNPATGQTTWLDFPNFIDVRATNAWKVSTGSFTVKPYNDTPFKVGKLGAAIVVDLGNVIYVDDFRISR